MTRKKPYSIRISRAAKIDLAEIWEYFFCESSELVATEVVERIERRFQQAAQFPFSGTPRPHLAPDMRVLFHEQYAIYYIPGAGEITVVRVLHGARSGRDCGSGRLYALISAST